MGPRIRVLSDSMISKIAAGEVVERPASVLKELAENSIDAGALHVAAEIRGGGRQLLRVADDGAGMVRADAALCVERHATSKVSQPSDLVAIETLGFRGEALAAIGAVARLCIETRSPAEEEGTRVVVEGGVRRSLNSCARAPGTTVEVRDLFFNTPARRKFLRHEATETRHCVHTLVQLAAARPDVGFHLVEAGRTLAEFLAGSPRSRAAEVLGVDPAQLIEVAAGEAGVHVRGYLAGGEGRRTGGRGLHFLVVRGRPVYARALNQAVIAGYGGLLGEDVQPAYVLWLDLDPARVDANVHPTKRQIRFADEQAVAALIQAAVGAAVRGPWAPWLPRQAGGSGGVGGASVARDHSVEHPAPGAAEPASADQRSPADDGRLEAETLATSAEPGAAEGQGPPDHRAPGEARVNWDCTQRVLELAALVPSAIRPQVPSVEELANLATGPATSVWQLHGEFALVQCQEGLLVVDLRAAFERVVYERALAASAGAEATSQQMLFPLSIRLSPCELSTATSYAAELSCLGFGMRGFGRDTVLVEATPAGIGEGLAEAVLRHVLADIADLEPRSGAVAVAKARRELVARAYARRAAAARCWPTAGAEGIHLLEDLAATSDPYVSPSGRVTVVRLSLRQVRQLFERAGWRRSRLVTRPDRRDEGMDQEHQ